MDQKFYNIERFAELLSKAKGKRSINKYGFDSEVDAAYISRLLRGLIKKPPSAVIINKLAAKSHNNVTAEELMVAAGYIESEKITEDLEVPLTFQQFKEEYKEKIRNSQDEEEIKELKNELTEWFDLIGIEEFMKDIDLSDESLEEKYNFTYKGKPLNKDKLKKILSYIRFVGQED